MLLVHSRDDPAGKGKNYWYFPFVDNWSGGNKGDAKPRYGDNSYTYYYHPGIKSKADGCTSQGYCGQFTGLLTYRTWWKLPGGFKCNHCKLEWVSGSVLESPSAARLKSVVVFDCPVKINIHYVHAELHDCHCMTFLSQSGPVEGSP